MSILHDRIIQRLKRLLDDEPIDVRAFADDVRVLMREQADDAARYRWLRDRSRPGLCAFYLDVGQAFKGVRFEARTVDEAIDAQIEKEQR